VIKITLPEEEVLDFSSQPAQMELKTGEEKGKYSPSEP
jgi:hypothetical protein